MATAQRKAEARLREVNADLERRVEQKTAGLRSCSTQAARAEADASEPARTNSSPRSRELRGPLQGIVGYAPLLVSGTLDAATTNCPRSHRPQCKRPGAGSDLLDVSRAVAGKLTLDLGTVDLRTTVEAALLNVQRSADANGVLLSLDVEEAVEPISADSNRLQQVIWNLLSNAVKFTPRGGNVAVRIRGDVAGVLVEVQDSGSGIDPRFLPHVFDPFRQAEPSTTRTQGGLGLGLSIVRHCLAHGGTVEAHSDGPDEGDLRIPPAVQHRSAPSEERMERRPERASAAGRRTRVRPRRPRTRGGSLAVAVLPRSDCSPADSAARAAEAIERLHPDVLLSDLGMPGEDGFALMARLRSLGRTIPAIAVTGFASPADRERTRAAGFRQHLAKPIDHDQLVAAIVELAARRSPDGTTEPVITRSS
jgi:signal transduction histidine kinase